MRGISHDWQDESLEAKARWFRTLTPEERLEYLIEMTNLILENNPGIADRKYAEPLPEGVRVVKLP
jgi:hypothetical protein